MRVPPHSRSSSPLSNSSSPKTPKQFHTEGFQSVLSGLGILEKDILSFSLMKGFQADFGLSEAQFIEINQQQTTLLNALGISNAHLAIVLSSEDEVALIKKRMKRIKESAFSDEVKHLIATALGVDITDDSVFFTDTAGGVIIIQAGLHEIEDSLNQE